MKEKIVLITGALAGIGRVTALDFAQQGAHVVVTGRREAEGQALAEELRRFGGQAHFELLDVRDEEQTRRVIGRTIDRFGHLDIAVNNAGTEGLPGPLVEQTLDGYLAAFDTNVLGTFLSIKHELLAMRGQRSGSIVNLSSTMGSRGAAGASMYVASKHAVEGLTKSAALEAAEYNIRVNAVAPGPVATDLLDRFTGGTPQKLARMVAGVPLGRVGAAAEIARVIVFVASDAASFMTGQIIGVNGGKTAL